MADDKNGRERQARNEERRQREREIAMELERWDEPEPPIEDAALDEVEAALESLEFPATGSEVVESAGDAVVESPTETYTVESLVPDTEAETFEAPAAVRSRIQRPSVAGAMKRVAEACETLQDENFRDSRRDAYEKTFRALVAIDAVDEDEGIEVVADWIVDRIETEGELPGSRAVRRRAAKYCRENGYTVRSDEWLGV